MDTSSSAASFGYRLERLNREIHSSLHQVRQHLEALERVERDAGDAGAAAPEFDRLLREALERERRNAADHSG